MGNLGLYGKVIALAKELVIMSDRFYNENKDSIEPDGNIEHLIKDIASVRNDLTNLGFDPYRMKE